MTTQEFSNEFDLLLDSYKNSNEFTSKDSSSSIEFNEYEKSVFLTQAQEDLVKNLYNGYNVE